VVHVPDLLSNIGLLHAATPAELDKLADASFGRYLKRGQILVREGQPADLLFLVVAGRLKVYVASPRGESLSLAVLGPGEVLGLFGVIDGRPRSANIEALEDARLICIPAAAYRELLKTNAAVSLSVAEELAFRLRDLTGSAADLVFLDLPRRLAKLLVSAAGDDGLSLTQTEIADQLGATRSSVNRNLAAFQRRGWIETTRSHTEILDRDSLAAFGDS
jgi:CRP-like cAMP-binding protein